MSNPLADLREADEAYRDAEARVAEHGEDRLVALADALDRATGLLDRYEGRATGTGDFKAFVEFQGEFSDLVDNLPDDMPNRDAFERAEDALDKRRLSERDFDRVRSDLDGVADLAALLDEREAARKRYRDARRAVSRRIAELDERIDHLERLLELGDADLDAPVSELRDPVEAYDEAVTEAFRAFRRDASAREIVRFLDAAEHYPLIDFDAPPDDLREYLRRGEVGNEPLPTIREYADYSRSKLDHYVGNPDALKRHVATNETYLDRLGAEPLRIGWPPSSAAELRWWCREAIPLVDRFAPPAVVERLRDVRSLTDGADRFDRLRTAARARDELSEDERERLARGEVEEELAETRARRERLREALDERSER